MTGFREALDDTNEKYLAHFGRTAVALKGVCDEVGIPLDASGVNAVAFTTYKATKDAFGHMPTKAAPSSAPAPQAAPSGEFRALKLENAGDEAFIAVSSVGRGRQGNFGAPYQFFGSLLPSGDAVMLEVGDKSVERQCEFLKIQASDLAGKTVQFSRAPNPKGKPFWNLKVVKGDVAKPAKSFQDAPDPAPSDDFDLF